MNISDCSRIGEAPDHGWMLVYTRKEIIFEPYESQMEAVERLKNEEILEVHFFDNEKEYRCLESRSCRYDGKVEAVADFPADDESSVYKETILLEKPWEKDKITVLNHISYEDGSTMGHIDNYRLVMHNESSGKEGE